jgi:type IV secretion system protein TrbL
MRISKHLQFLVMALVLLAIFCPDSCFAERTSFEEIADKFQSVSSQYIEKLKDYALSLFKLFLLVDVVIFGIKAALNRSEIGDTIAQFIITLIFASFCYVAILNYDTWTTWLLEKSQTIAVAAGGEGAKVTFDPLNVGLDILSKVIDAAPTGLSPSAAIQSLGYLILGGVIMASFCLMAARMLVVLCESYIAMSAAILLLGFGGSSMTKDYAINAMRYAVSVAFKLFTIRLVMAVGLTFINNLGVFNEVDLQGMFMILAAAIVLLVLVNSLPETVAGIINGSHVGSGVGLGSAAGTAAAMVGGTMVAGAAAALGGARMASTVSKAQKIASLQGHGGIGGTAGQLWNSFKAARQQDGAAGGVGSTLRRMRTDIKDMHEASQAMNDANYRMNPYRAEGKNPYTDRPGSGNNSGAFGDGSGQTTPGNPT